mgnify:CR=1 FL=1
MNWLLQTEIEGLNGQLAKTRVDGDAVAGQLRSRIAALEEEVKRAIAMGQSDAVDAATKVGVATHSPCYLSLKYR